MNRQNLLALGTALLLVVSVIWWIVANWGLITLDVDGKPLRTVVASISKQAGVPLRTNIDPETPVSCHVRKVRLPEALDALALNADARWAFVTIAAPAKPALTEGANALASATPVEDWRFVFHPLPGMFGQALDVPSTDPRREIWQVSAPGEATLQNYFDEAARAVEVGFMIPKNWNPRINQAPASGAVPKVTAKLVRAASGVSTETYFLYRRLSRGERPEGREEGQQPWPDETQTAWMTARFEKQISRLPPEERAEAKAEFDDERKFWTEVRALPPEQRRAKMQEHMSDPERQAKREERGAARDAKRSPEQRLQRMRSYIQRKEAARAPKS